MFLLMDSVVMFQGTIYENGYGQIARAVMRDKSLHRNSKVIYAYICSFASNSNSGERSAFPSVKLQCAEIGIAEETYYIYRKPLVEKGYIKIEKRRGESAKFDRNLYIICAVQIPLEPKKTILGNSEVGENVDVEPFEPYSDSPSTAEPSTVKSGTKTKSTKTKSTKKNNSLVSSSREANPSIYELIDKEMKKAYSDVPFDLIREELINDETADIGTAKQYYAMLEYRIKLYIKKQKARKQPTRPQSKAKAPIRKELLPDWFDDENEPPMKSEKPNELSNEDFDLEAVLKEIRKNNK